VEVRDACGGSCCVGCLCEVDGRELLLVYRGVGRRWVAERDESWDGSLQYFIFITWAASTLAPPHARMVTEWDLSRNARDIGDGENGSAPAASQ